ncbi:MAG: efflux transporter outer membrane subunit [Planctomycetes bacterium]|nr:efflux transporter outer membrane subunit [Planctomycetota bacterium]
MNLRPLHRLALGAMLGLAACKSGPDYAPPELPTPANWSGIDAHFDASATNTTAQTAWWQTLGCAHLDELVQQALAANHDLLAAAARIQQARALAGIADAADSVQINATTGYMRTRTTKATPSPIAGRSYDTWSLGLDVSWEIDLFGRLARESEARTAEVQLAEADREGIQQSLIAEVVSAYADLRGADHRRAVARSSIEASEQLVQITRVRADSGTGNDLDTARAERLLASARSRLPAQEQQWRRSAHRLAVLVGRTPGELVAALRDSADLSNVPDLIALGLPAELIRRRPDVSAAERRLAAATARLGTALADRYPRLSITGFFGLEADRASEIFRSTSRAMRAGPALQLPLFTGGTVTEQIAVREAQIDEARAELEQSVLRAFEEVENGVAGLQQERLHLAELSNAVEAAERARTFAQQRFDTGIDDFLSVLDAEQARLDLADQRAVATTELVRQFAALHKALGSGG